MKTISLKSFAESGRFDSIEIGSSKSKVIELLGTDFDFADCGETQILKYGWYEFFFWSDSEKLFGIQNDHLQADCTNHHEMIKFENKNFKVDNWFLTIGKDFKFSEVISFMKTEQIQFKIEEAYKNGPEILKFNSGVYFDFSEGSYTWHAETNKPEEITIENQEDYLLNGIRLFDLNKK